MSEEITVSQIAKTIRQRRQDYKHVEGFYICPKCGGNVSCDSDHGFRCLDCEYKGAKVFLFMPNDNFQDESEYRYRKGQMALVNIEISWTPLCEMSHREDFMDPDAIASALSSELADLSEFPPFGDFPDENYVRALVEASDHIKRTNNEDVIWTLIAAFTNSETLNMWLPAIEALERIGAPRMRVRTVPEEYYDIRVVLDKYYDGLSKTKDKFGISNDHGYFLQAASCGYTGILSALIKRGVNINIQDEDGKTALMWAVKFGRFACISMLLENRADGYVKDKDGKRALDIAVEKRDSAKSKNEREKYCKILGML